MSGSHGGPVAWCLHSCPSLAPKDAAGAPLQSISASDLLKQQKQKQKEFLQNRRRRADEIQKRVLQSSAGPRPGSSSSSLIRDGLTSPKAACEVPAATHAPTLGRGFSEGEDILFFEKRPSPAPAPSALSLSAAKLIALKKLRAKGMGLEKEDPNAVKRKRSNNAEINARVEKNQTSPNGTHTVHIFRCQSYFCLLVLLGIFYLCIFTDFLCFCFLFCFCFFIFYVFSCSFSLSAAHHKPKSFWIFDLVAVHIRKLFTLRRCDHIREDESSLLNMKTFEHLMS